MAEEPNNAYDNPGVDLGEHTEPAPPLDRRQKANRWLVHRHLYVYGVPFYFLIILILC